jgi:hypothetical protein
MNNTTFNQLIKEFSTIPKPDLTNEKSDNKTVEQPNKKPSLQRKKPIHSYEEFISQTKPVFGFGSCPQLKPLNNQPVFGIGSHPQSKPINIQPVKRHADLTDENVKRIKLAFTSQMTEMAKDHKNVISSLTIKNKDITQYVLHIKEGDLTKQYEHVFNN